MEDLPPEVLLKILAFVFLKDFCWSDVVAVGAVPQLRRLRWDASLWQHIRIAKDTPSWCLQSLARTSASTSKVVSIENRGMVLKPLPHRLVSKLLSSCQNLTTLNFEQNEFLLTDNLLLSVARSGAQLEGVSGIVRVHVSDEGLAPFIKASAPQLKRLVIEQPWGHVSDITAKAIACTCKNLQILSLKNCQHITDAGLDPILRNCSQLREIHVGGNRLTNRSVQTIVKHLSRSLEILDFEGFTLFQQIHCTDETIVMLVDNCLKLKSLAIGDVNFFAGNLSIERLALHGISLRIGQWVLIEAGGYLASSGYWETFLRTR